MKTPNLISYISTPNSGSNILTPNPIYEKNKNSGQKNNFCILCESKISFPGICVDCLNFILKSLKDSYKNYLYIAKEDFNKLSSKIDTMLTLNHFMDENQQINVSNKTIKIKELYPILNVKKEDLINKIKQLICINCLNNISVENINYILLPCNCYLCNKECLEDFFKKFDFNQKSNKYEKKRVSYVCICSQEYFNKDILDIAYIFYKNNLKEDLRKALNLYTINFVYYCSNCSNKLTQKELDTYQKKLISYYKLKVNQNNEMNKFYKEKDINGILCDKCYSNKKLICN
jgi:hypothetical protein